MEELIKNASEFIESAEDNLKKKRFNVSVADFFKAIVVICDYLIYKEIKILPKNHNERFSLLQKYFSNIYQNVSNLFEIYTKSYNLRLTEKDALILRSYTYEIKNFIDKK